MYPVDDEDCVAYGICACGLKKYFLNYYGETKKGVTLKGLGQRVDELNKEAGVEFEKIRITIPPRGNRALMRDYYETNKVRILAQVNKYGFNATKVRLGISRRTLTRIVKRIITLQ
jgi:hypothetical protein